MSASPRPHRWFARFLRGFAFSLIGVVALAIALAPRAQAALGDGNFLANLLPTDVPRISLWLAVAALNAASAFYLAATIDAADD